MEGKVVLVLEDELPLLNAIKKKLETKGCTVVGARSVDQAFGYLQDLNHVDVIWLDHYLLGKEDGLDFVTKIKGEGSKWESLPIFVVSNTASQEKINEYLKLGVKKYFTKADHRLDNIIEDIKKYI